MTSGDGCHTDPPREPMTVGQAVHRLHAALPREADFTVGRREWTHSGVAADRLRCEPDGFRRDEEWCVTVQQAGDLKADARGGGDGYLHVAQAMDLESAVEAAIARYGQWRRRQAAQGKKPPKLTAPGASERRHDDGREREVS
jgi:hypothetical protein